MDVVIFTVLELFLFKSWKIAEIFVSVSNLGLLQQNSMHHIHNASYHKTQIKFEYFLC